MSDIPQTDAVMADFAELVTRYTNAAMPTQVIVDGLELVHADFARALERQLAAKDETITFLSRLSDEEGAAKERANELIAAMRSELDGLKTLCGESARALRQIKDLANVNEHTRQMLVSIGNTLNERSK